VANDTDDETALSITATSSPLHLTATKGQTGISIVPEANYFGTAGFDYTVSDGTLTTNAHVTLTLSAVSDAPVAVVDNVHLGGSATGSVSVVQLLANDYDVESNTLTIASVRPLEVPSRFELGNGGFADHNGRRWLVRRFRRCWETSRMGRPV